MADRDVESDQLGVPQINPVLESLLLQVLDEAQEAMENGEEVIPFTALLVEDTIFEEEHEGTTEECFESAQLTVEGAEGARAYALCYDGYIDTDAGQVDALIAEGGVPDEAQGVAVGLIYEIDGDNILFEDEVCYIAPAPNFMAGDIEVSPIIEDEPEEE